MLAAACSSGSTNGVDLLGGAAGTDEPGGTAGTGTAGKAGKAGSTSTAGTKGDAGTGDGGTGDGGTGDGGTTAAGKGGSGGKSGAAGKAGSGGKAGKGGSGDAGTGDGGTGDGGTGDGGTGDGGTGDVGGKAGSGTAGKGGKAGSGTAGTGTAGTGTAGTGTAGTGNDPGAGGSGQLCPFPPCNATGGSAGSGTAGSGTVINCNSKTGEDNDKDGFAVPEDCNDCDPAVNPGAIDILNTDANGGLLPDNQQVDEDCSGSAKKANEIDTCDLDLTLAEADGVKGANAIDICQTTTAAAKTWGIISADYVQLDGKPLPAKSGSGSTYVDPAFGHGIMPAFGTKVTNKYGKNMLVLSTGAARLPDQANYSSPGGGDKNYTTTNPTGFPILSPSCSAESGTLHDSIALRVKVRAPTNAKSLSFQFKFYTYEFPDYVCSQYNDAFVVIMRDKDGKFIPGANEKTGNIAFDKNKNYLSVNAGFLDVCDPQTIKGTTYACEAGTDDLLGTGFGADSDETFGDNHAATTWLQTTAPVTPGQEYELLFGITDAGDGSLSSTVLLDSFKWSADAGTVSTGRACEQGGTGTCTTCFNDNLENCCGSQYNACAADGKPTETGCAGIFFCQNACAGNAACLQSCFNSHPAGQAKYTAYQDCMFGPAGSTTNFGACGVVCK